MQDHRETSKLRAILKRAPSLVLLAISVSLLVAFWQPSAKPDIFIFSTYRFVAVATMFLVGVYFTISLYFKTLLGANNMLCYTVMVGGIALESVLRFFPSLIPDDYLSLLPFEAGQVIHVAAGARHQVRGDRGLVCSAYGRKQCETEDALGMSGSISEGFYEAS